MGLHLNLSRTRNFKINLETEVKYTWQHEEEKKSLIFFNSQFLLLLSLIYVTC